MSDTVCFKECEYTIEEGIRVKLDLYLSRPLLNRHTVQLQYDDITASSSKSFIQFYYVHS